MITKSWTQNSVLLKLRDWQFDDLCGSIKTHRLNAMDAVKAFMADADTDVVSAGEYSIQPHSVADIEWYTLKHDGITLACFIPSVFERKYMISLRGERIKCSDWVIAKVTVLDFHLRRITTKFKINYETKN